MSLWLSPVKANLKSGLVGMGSGLLPVDVKTSINEQEGKNSWGLSSAICCLKCYSRWLSRLHVLRGSAEFMDNNTESLGGVFV